MHFYRPKRLATGCAIAMAALAPSASAHHSPVMFDQSKTVTLSGTVSLLQWTNPHCYIQPVVEKDGRQTEWNIEMGAPVYLYNRALEFVVTPEQTLILTIYRDVRRIATDGRALSAPEDRWVTAWGESVGRWEGDTLVIETVAVRQPNLFFRAPPFSEAAHYTETLRKVGPDRIEGELTIVAPEALTGPWTLKQAYVRAEGLHHLVYDTFSNDRTTLEDGLFAILPPEEEPRSAAGCGRLIRLPSCPRRAVCG